MSAAWTELKPVTCNSFVSFVLAGLALVTGSMPGSTPARAQNRSDEIVFKQVAPDLHFLYDFAGSNVLVLTTAEGVLVIDTRTHPRLGQDMIDRIRKISDKPIKWVVNSHFHGDHHMGNAPFKTTGATFVAQNETARLMQNPACERDRERSRMKAESNPNLYGDLDDDRIVVPQCIKDGDRLTMERKFDEALTAYEQELANCRVELDADPANQLARKRFRRAVCRVGLLADTLLHVGEFEQAIMIADVALAAAATPYWVAETTKFYDRPITSSTWFAAIRAHACMLVGRLEQARAFYFSVNSDKRGALTSWETSILRDFARLRKIGYAHPLMQEVEIRYAEAGWSTARLNANHDRPKMKPEETSHLAGHSDKVESGDKLRDAGHLHEAMTVYLRNLKRWSSNLKKDGFLPEWKQNLGTAVNRVSATLHALFREGKFFTPVDFSDQACSLAPGCLPLQAMRACALMLHGGRDQEARAIFVGHRGEIVDGKTWEGFIHAQFCELRKAGCERPLMNEIEARFAGAPELSEAIADRQSESDAVKLKIPTPPSDIPSGDKLRQLGKLEEALAAYCLCLENCNAKIAKFSAVKFNMQVIEDRASVITRLSNLALQFVIEGKFEKALEATQSALLASPQSPLPNIRRAHALMLLGRAEEAKDLYQNYRDKKVDPETWGAEQIATDIVLMRKGGLAHSVMADIESQVTNPPFEN
jgi:tetratricopeptide (TPR) repeat protein